MVTPDASIPWLETVGEGPLSDDPGGRWTLQAGGIWEHLYTFMDVELADGHREGGGFGGPALRPGRMMEIHVRTSDRIALQIIGRVHSAVHHVLLQFAGDGRDPVAITPADDPADLGVRFFGAVFLHPTDVSAAVAVDLDGELLDRQDVGRLVSRAADLRSGGADAATPHTRESQTGRRPLGDPSAGEVR